MDQQYEELKAHVSVLETIVFLLTKRDPDAARDVHDALAREAQTLRAHANRPNDPIDMSVVRSQPRAARNHLAEEALAAAYERLSRKF